MKYFNYFLNEIFVRFLQFPGNKRKDFQTAMNFISHMFRNQKKEVENSVNCEQHLSSILYF